MPKLSSILNDVGEDSAQQSLLSSQAVNEIAASGLFDPEYYGATYGPLPKDGDALEHYLKVGLPRGHRPSGSFDPVLYRLTVMRGKRSNPLQHYARSGKACAPAEIAALFPGLLEKYSRKNRWAARREPLTADKIREHREYHSKIAQERRVQFESDDKTYCVLVPSPDFFFNRLRNKDPFAFVRLPHGFWDALSLREQIAAEPEFADLSPAERRGLACRIGLAIWPHHGGFVEGFTDETLELIVQNKGNPYFFNSIAFKGYPTPDENMFDAAMTVAERHDRVALLKQLFSCEDRLLDAALWKRMAYSGDLSRLPDALRDRPVVLIGPDFLSDLGRRWGVSSFSHVVIPPHLSQRIRWQLYESARALLTEISRSTVAPPVLLTQCGGSLAYWLISRLAAWNQNISCIDLGQAVNIWFLEKKELSRPKWMQLLADK